MKRTKTFGGISLPIFPPASSQKFNKLSYLQNIDDTQQCLLDNIWSTAGDDQKFLTSLNALTIYFQEQSFQQAKNCFLSNSSGDVSLNQSLISNSNHCSSSGDTLPVPPRCYKILLDRCHRLQDQVNSLQQQIKSMKRKTSITPLVMAEHMQSSPLDDGESVCKFFSKTLALPKIKSLIPNQIPPEIITHIHYKAQQKSQHFQEFIFKTLVLIAGQNPFHYPEILPGLTFTWDTLYHQNPNHINCPRIKPHCQQIPLERLNCECNLIYSIPQACINLSTFHDLTIIYENQEIQITPMTLLNYGFLKQLIFTNPEQTNRVTRKMAICVNNIFSLPSTTICQVIIQSKMPEWTPLGTIIPAQHIMHITASQTSDKTQLNLLGCEFPTWICSNPISQQMKDYIAYQIASHIGDANAYTLQQYQFKLFSEDPIQKIRTINYYGEVPFLFHTNNIKSVKFFEDYIQQSEDDYPTIPPSDDLNFWDNLSEESFANINNQMDP